VGGKGGVTRDGAAGGSWLAGGQSITDHPVKFGQPVFDHFLDLDVVQYGLRLRLDGLLERVDDDVPQQRR